LRFSPHGRIRIGIARIVTALVVLVIVLSAVVGVVGFQTNSNISAQKKTSVKTVTETVTTTTTLSAGQLVLAAGIPKNCITKYPNGLDLNNTNYFVDTNDTENIAQICIKYTYEPQKVWGMAAQEINKNGTMDANFSAGTAIMYQDSFGGGGQGGPLPFDVVSPSPSYVVFNSTGQSVTVVYSIEWWFLFSNFIPSYVGCNSTLAGIGVADGTGPGYSGLKSTCPNGSIGSMFTAEIVGTTYLKLENS
jgi:hypothetical protein